MPLKTLEFHLFQMLRAIAVEMVASVVEQNQDPSIACRECGANL
jgi:hypothetical protein